MRISEVPFLAVTFGELYAAVAGTGPTAVFLHGGLLDHRMYLPQLRQLSATRRCVALDLRGCGRSTSLLGPWDDDEHAADVEAVLEQLGGEPCDVVGLSLGASIGLSLARRRPDLVRTLALFSTRMAAVEPARARMFRELGSRIVEGGRHGLAIEFAGRMAGDPSDLDLVARVCSMTELTPYETAIAVYERNATTPDRSAELAMLGCPLLIAAGELDSQVPAERVHELGRLVPAARMAIVAGSGHLPTLERPEETNALLVELWSSA